MEMISPSQYREKGKDKSIDELITLKKQLEEDIDNLSKTENDNSLFLSDTRLSMKKEYLAEISKLIDEKTNNNGEVQKKIIVEHCDLSIPNQEKNLDKLSQLLDMPIANVQLNSKRLNDVNATYYYNSTRGGKSVILSDDGSYLATGFATSFERLLEEFNNGRRNGNFSEDKSIIIKCHSCGNEITINTTNFPKNVKTLDTQCSKCQSFIKYGNPNYEEKSNEFNVIELSAIIRTGIPTKQHEDVVLLVSNDYAVVDNKRYELSKVNKQEIDNLVKNNYNELKKIFEEQTPEFLSSHIAYNNTSKIFILKLSTEKIKISYQIGTESDNKIKKLIDDITSLVFGKTNNSNGLKNIMDSLFSGLTGDSKKDFDYLNGKIEEYKNHPLTKEIASEIERKLYDMLPEDSKKEFEKYYDEDLENINKMLKEVKTYIFSQNKNLEKAKEILLDFIKGSLIYDNDSKTDYYNFSDVIDFVLYTRIYKSEKNIKWINIPFVTAYSYLAYIYNEEGNYEEALKMIDKTIRWSPMNLSPLFEKCETYKMQKKWDEFKNITESLYDKIYSAIDLAHYYRNLGYYYIETNNLDLAYALYTTSIKFEKNNNAYGEMAYINQQLNRDNYNMSADGGLNILKNNNIPFGPKQENLNRLTEIYSTEKELIKNPSVEMQLASRIYHLTLDKRFAPFFELVDKYTMCSIIIPRSWSPVKEEFRKEQFGDRNMFAVYTDYNSLFQANYDGKCSKEQFDEAYKLNINNMVNHKTLNLKLLDEGILTLKLQQGMKEFKHALFDMNIEDRTIRSMHYFTIINGIFADFSITLDKKIDYKYNETFNNQKGMRDIVNLLANIIELKVQDDSAKDKTIDNNSNSDSEIITHNIMFNENLNFNVDFPKKLGQLSHPNDTSFKIGTVITIMNAKCNSEELLNKRSKEWLENSTKTNGQTMLDDLNNEYSLKNNSIKVVEKTVTKDNKNRHYKFIYYNQTMLIFGYNNKELSKTIDDAIISLKSILKQKKIQRDPFEKPNNSIKLLRRNELADKFYGYHSKNNIDSKNATLDYLNLIKEYLNDYEFKTDNNFVFCSRKKFIYDEITNVLNSSQKEKEPLYFVLGSLEEFMSNDNFINSSETNYAEVKAKNDDYIKNGYICLEEKKYIDNIIKAIEDYISNDDDSKNIDDNENMSEVYTNYTGMNISEIKQLILEKIDLLSKKLNGQTDEKEKSNSGYLFWNCKMILRNISDACNKLINKYQNDISKDDFEHFNNLFQSIKNDESLWKSMDDIELTFNKISDCQSEIIDANYKFYKKNESNAIWWVEKNDSIGEHLFTFDKKKIYNLFRDYPYELSGEEKKIFDKENPYWADFFKYRNSSIEKTDGKNIKYKITMFNWGTIGPNSITGNEFNIYDDLSIELKVSKNNSFGTDKTITTLYGSITQEKYDEIENNIQTAKDINTKVEAFDGDAWSFEKYENSNLVWKREMGYIYGITPLTEITKILHSIDYKQS